MIQPLRPVCRRDLRTAGSFSRAAPVSRLRRVIDSSAAAFISVIHIDGTDQANDCTSAGCPYTADKSPFFLFPRLSAHPWPFFPAHIAGEYLPAFFQTLANAPYDHRSFTLQSAPRSGGPRIARITAVTRMPGKQNIRHFLALLSCREPCRQFTGNQLMAKR